MSVKTPTTLFTWKTPWLRSGAGAQYTLTVAHSFWVHGTGRRMKEMMAFAKSVGNRVIELTPNGVIDRLTTFDSYINDPKIKELRIKLYS